MLSERLPLLLTVEEAGSLLRVGRTKAYAMAREWRETDGRSGLPVIDLGHVLRVPRRALEEMVGAELPNVPSLHPANEASEIVASVEPSQAPANVPSEEPPSRRPTTTDRSRRRRKPMANQLDLFDSELAAS